MQSNVSSEVQDNAARGHCAAATPSCAGDTHRRWSIDDMRELMTQLVTHYMADPPTMDPHAEHTEAAMGNPNIIALLKAPLASSSWELSEHECNVVVDMFQTMATCLTKAIKQQQSCSGVGAVTTPSCMTCGTHDHHHDDTRPSAVRVPKRIRRKAAAILRLWPCYVSRCTKSYGTEHALKNHIQTKHPWIEYARSDVRGHAGGDERDRWASAVLSTKSSDDTSTTESVLTTTKDSMDKSAYGPLKWHKYVARLDTTEQVPDPDDDDNVPERQRKRAKKRDRTETHHNVSLPIGVGGGTDTGVNGSSLASITVDGSGMSLPTSSHLMLAPPYGSPATGVADACRPPMINMAYPYVMHPSAVASTPWWTPYVAHPHQYMGVSTGIAVHQHTCASTTTLM